MGCSFFYVVHHQQPSPLFPAAVGLIFCCSQHKCTNRLSNTNPRATTGPVCCTFPHHKGALTSQGFWAATEISSRDKVITCWGQRQHWIPTTVVPLQQKIICLVSKKLYPLLFRSLEWTRLGIAIFSDRYEPSQVDLSARLESGTDKMGTSWATKLKLKVSLWATSRKVLLRSMLIPNWHKLKLLVWTKSGNI